MHGLRIDPASLRDQLVEEVYHALWAPAHEGRQSSYGAIITDHWDIQHNYLEEYVNGECLSCDCNDGRFYANGISSFFVSNKRARPLIWCARQFSFTDEASVFSLRDEVLFGRPGVRPHDAPSNRDFIILKRFVDGTLLIMHWAGITSFKNGNWNFKPYQYALRVEETLRERRAEITQDMEETLRRLMRLCLHVLSPAGCGATLIAHLAHDEPLDDLLDRDTSCKSLQGITLTHRWQHDAIAHRLKRVDGAVIVDEVGRLKEIGVFFRMPRGNLGIGRRGARWRSAISMSKAIQSPVVMVSSDGPVFVFYKGEEIVSSHGTLQKE